MATLFPFDCLMIPSGEPYRSTSEDEIFAYKAFIEALLSRTGIGLPAYQDTFIALEALCEKWRHEFLRIGKNMPVTKIRFSMATGQATIVPYFEEPNDK